MIVSTANNAILRNGRACLYMQGWCTCLLLAWKTQQDTVNKKNAMQHLCCSCEGPYCLSRPLQIAILLCISYYNSLSCELDTEYMTLIEDYWRLYLKTLHGIFAALSKWCTLGWGSGSRSRAALRCLRRRIFEYLLHFDSNEENS